MTISMHLCTAFFSLFGLCGESNRFVRSVEVRVVFDAEAGAVRADADVEDADDAQPSQQVDWD